jgi:hypothetical protein
MTPLYHSDPAPHCVSPRAELANGVDVALAEFAEALAAMPFGQERLTAGQQFNAYESAANEEHEDPRDWRYYLSLGPITDCVQILRIEGDWRAKLVESALRVALRLHRARASQ